VSGDIFGLVLIRFGKILSLQMSAVAEIRPALAEPENARAFANAPDFDLLLACCADSSSCDETNSIRRTLSGPLDWERLLDLVDHHRVVPQVYSQLSALAHLVPERQLDALRTRYRDNARKTLWFSGELVRVLAQLESRGIPALPLKGPVLAETLYGEVTQRQFGDLDILVHEEDVLRAKTALLDLGFKPGIELAPNQERDFVHAGYECPFDSAHSANLLELQWQILPRFYSVAFDVRDLFERADEITFGGRRMRTLCAEDLLLVLCVHAAKHVWVQLSWLGDIAQLTKSRRLDWDAIHDEAQRLGIERIVSLNLFLAHKLLGSTLPLETQKSLRQDLSITVLADEILRLIERSVHSDTASLPYFRLMMRLRERWQDRARLIWRLAFTPGVSEWSTIRLPKLLQPLYRLVRLSRLARKLASVG
jgi:hypothetical protein